MTMDVTVSISPSTVVLGQPVTITFDSTGFQDTVLTIDNFPAPIDIGSGDVSGSIKVLPLTDGQFTVEIKGSGRFGGANDYIPEMTKTASCTVT
jgi:hypothetical protein